MYDKLAIKVADGTSAAEQYAQERQRLKDRADKADAALHDLHRLVAKREAPMMWSREQPIELAEITSRFHPVEAITTPPPPHIVARLSPLDRQKLTAMAAIGIPWVMQDGSLFFEYVWWHTAAGLCS
jgi:hypothetical protein